jgi:hypothetical protein
MSGFTLSYTVGMFILNSLYQNLSVSVFYHGHVSCRGNVLTEPLPSNGCLLWFCYPGFQQLCHFFTFSSIFRSH